MKISFVGAGNVAWHLAPAFENVGHKVIEVYSRDSTNAKKLSSRLYEAKPITSLDLSKSEAQLLVIALADDAIEEVLKELIIPDNTIVVHTSGSKELAVLNFIPTSNTGVFYPLQTFSKSKKVDFNTLPILIESEEKSTLKILLKLGKAISKNVTKVSSSSRKALHISAVFASNFTNHMLSISSELLKDNSLDFSLLKPLIIETINKSLAIGPLQAQTGPARRHDLGILENHKEYLSSQPELAEIYHVISQHIINTFPE
ncbi:MAG: DUF2520 domain-containing protein [Cyclobacteriaceae bacterium]|nr:DUF2520 domain-containing protein [Cyclobacteriaceae bacterium]